MEDDAVRTISCWLVAKDAERPIWDARGPLHRRETIVVEVVSEGGVVGHGSAPSWGLALETVASFVLSELADLVRGRRAADVREIHRGLVRRAQVHGGGGVASMAIGGVDSALWDLQARTRGMSLGQLIAGNTESVVAAYASTGFYQAGEGESDLSGLEVELGTALAAGYRAVKIKCGRGAIAEDIVRVQRARDLVGPDVRLMVDANGAYQSVGEALEMAQALGEREVSWFEEPMDIDDEQAYHELCVRSPVPIAAGENACTLRKVERLVEAGVHVLQPDVGWTEGVTTAVSVAETAGAEGRRFAPHTFGSSLNLLFGAHVLAAAPSRDTLEVEWTGNPLMSELATVDWTRNLDSDGNFVVPSAPGTGFTPNFDAVDMEWRRLGPIE